MDESKQEKIKALANAKAIISTLEKELNEANEKTAPGESDLTKELSETKDMLKQKNN